MCSLLHHKIPALKFNLAMLRILVQYLILQDDIDEQIEGVHFSEGPSGSRADVADRENEKLTKKNA